MQYAYQLILEASVVAVVTAVALAISVKLSGPITSPGKAVLVGAVLGGMIHLTFELLGANKVYCSTGAACM